MNGSNVLGAIVFALLASSCDSDNGYTLYRNSAIDEKMRIHVATFDSADGNDYNSNNCEIARRLFQNQNGVIVRYWCEKGSFKR